MAKITSRIKTILNFTDASPRFTYLNLIQAYILGFFFFILSLGNCTAHMLNLQRVSLS
jgi:hypothetical protein